MPSTPQLLQHDFTAGIRRMRARDDLGSQQGANVLWDCYDYIVGRLGVPLGKRGGWTASTPFAGAHIMALCDGPFNGGHYLIGVDDDGVIWRTSGAFTSWGRDGVEVNAGNVKSNPVFFLDNLLIPSYNGTASMVSVNESHSEFFDSGTYDPQYLEKHRGRMWGIDGEVLIGGPPGNPVSQGVWDDDAAYDLSQPGRGLISIGRNMLIFFDGSTERMLGATPAGYGITNDDIDIQSFAPDVGLIDGFALCSWQASAIWVDKNGVWQSDGNSIPLDLTFQGHAKDLFLEFIRQWTSTSRVACGIYSDLLFVTMTETSGNDFVDCLVCDLPRRVWYRFRNCPFTCFAQNSIGIPKTWAGVETVEGIVAELSPVLNPTASNMADGDGTDVEPELETAYFRFGPQDSRLHQLFLGYEIDFDDTPAVESTVVWDSGIRLTALNHVDLDGFPVYFITSVSYLTISVEYESGGAAVRVYIPSGSNFADIGAALAASNVPLYLASTEVIAGHEGDTVVFDGTDSLTFSARTPIAIDTPVVLQVDFSLDPKANTTFESYHSNLIELEPRDIHGAADEGYHWKPIPVRAQAAGIAVRVRQSGPSAKTSIHALGSENQPFPAYTQR